MKLVKSIQEFLNKKFDYDWDGDGAAKITQHNKTKAVKFLTRYAQLLANHKIDIPTPSIEPCGDGSIDIHWKMHEKELLINIPKRGRYATFYGDTYIVSNKISSSRVNGTLDIQENDSEWLFLWLTS